MLENDQKKHFCNQHLSKELRVSFDLFHIDGIHPGAALPETKLLAIDRLVETKISTNVELVLLNLNRLFTAKSSPRVRHHPHILADNHARRCIVHIVLQSLEPFSRLRTFIQEAASLRILLRQALARVPIDHNIHLPGCNLTGLRMNEWGRLNRIKT